MLNRTERDVLPGKNGNLPPKPKSDKDKGKKSFEDRVLIKALEYLRGELKKAQAPVPLPEIAHS